MKKGRVVSRNELLDWLKGCAILAVVLDHTKVTPELFVFWSVNIFVLATACTYSDKNYVFTGKKLAIKALHLFYIVALGMFFFKALNFLTGVHARRTLLEVFGNPYYLLVKNSYLGDIWYIALHLQFLVLLFFFLKTTLRHDPMKSFVVAGIGTSVSVIVTHLLMGRFHTILVTSWLLFLWAGFYGMQPLLQRLSKPSHNRFAGLVAGTAVIALVYAFSSHYYWAFENNNRAFFVTLPFYAALVLVLTELFYILKEDRAFSAVTSFFALLGRYTLTIYLTHEPFEKVLKQYTHSPFLLVSLSIAGGIFFGMLSDKLFVPIKKQIEKIGKKEAGMEEEEVKILSNEGYIIPASQVIRLSPEPVKIKDAS